MTSNNKNKRILARGCDPVASQMAAKAIPPLIGDPQYIPTSNDVEFIEKLKTEKWDVIFFAPGACRFSAANQSIPGGNERTRGWSLEDYKALVFETQDNGIKVVESLSEQETVQHLKAALAEIN